MSSNSPITINISPRTVLMIIAILLGLGVIYLMSDVLLLIFVSVVVSAALEPSVSSIEKLRIPRLLAVTILYIGLLAFFVLVGALIVPRVSEQITDISQNIPHIQESFYQLLEGKPILGSISDELFTQLGRNSTDLISRVAGVTIGVVSSVIGVITFLVLTFYMLVGGKNISIGVVNAMIPSVSKRKRFFDISSRVSSRMGQWLRGQFFISLSTFLAALVFLGILNIEYALTLALIAGIMEFVPIVGSYIGAIPALLVAVTQSPSKAIVVLIFFVIWQLVQAHIIVPQVMRRVLGVPALLIFIAVLVFGRLLGFIGVILAAPITGAITVIVDEFSTDVKNRIARNDKKASSI